MFGSVEQPRRLTDKAQGDATEIATPLAGGKFRAPGRVIYTTSACVLIGMAWAIARNGWFGQPRVQSPAAVMEDGQKLLLSSNCNRARVAYSVPVTTTHFEPANETNFRQLVWADSAQTTLTRPAICTWFRSRLPISPSARRGSCSVTEMLSILENRSRMRFPLVRRSAGRVLQLPPIQSA